MEEVIYIGSATVIQYFSFFRWNETFWERQAFVNPITLNDNCWKSNVIISWWNGWTSKLTLWYNKLPFLESKLLHNENQFKAKHKQKMP